MVNLAGRKTRFSLQIQALAPVTLKTRFIQLNQRLTGGRARTPFCQ